jgi:hypothetical protein
LGERWPVLAGLSHADVGYSGRVLDGSSEPMAESQRADLGVM